MTPLLVVPLKTTKRCDVGPPLLAWLERADRPRDLSAFREDALRLTGLRNDLASSLCTAHAHAAALSDHALEDSLEYHACLWECERRGFPLDDEDGDGKEAGTPRELQVCWASAFAADGAKEGDVVRSSLLYERASVLFNVGALLSYRASVQDLHTQEGRSMASFNLRSSASTLAHLRSALLDHGRVVGPSAAPNGDARGRPVTSDLTDPALSMLIKSMLAEAQSVAYAAATARPAPLHALLAKIASGAAELYEAALSYSQHDLVTSRMSSANKTWGARLKGMAMLFRARAEHHGSAAERAEGRHGVELARLRRSGDMCREAIEFCQLRLKGSGEGGSGGSRDHVAVDDDNAIRSVSREAERLSRIVSERKEEATLDNSSLYHEEVPFDDALPKIEALDMVSKDPLPLDKRLDPANLERSFLSNLDR